MSPIAPSAKLTSVVSSAHTYFNEALVAPRDPILFAGGPINLYAYVNNDPVNRSDSSRLMWVALYCIAKVGGGMDIRTRDGGLLCVQLQDTGEGTLNGANLDSQDLSSAMLANVSMQGVILSDAVLRRADLSGADLYDAYCFRTDFSGADLRGACLRGANLEQARFDRAVLDGADLTPDNIGHKTSLADADLSRATLHGAKLAGAEYDQGTQFPDMFDPVKHGMMLRR